MKRNIALLLFAAVAGTAMADSYDYLTFRTADGAEQSITAVGTKIVFTDGNLVATNGSTTITKSLSDMSAMYFAATASGIADVTTDAVSASIIDGRLSVTAPAGPAVSLYTADGRQLSTSSHLDRGVYVVRVGSQTFKLCAE